PRFDSRRIAARSEQQGLLDPGGASPPLSCPAAHWARLATHSLRASIAASAPSATQTNAPALCAASRYSSCPFCHLLLVWSRRLISQTKERPAGIITSDAPTFSEPSSRCIRA